ncbi:hypothetical protein I656_00787 [Geobacillus sp. WSUCF1]|nr:hypothetical protein I656_00787 [Geobacillus sp. WSUCF1]
MPAGAGASIAVSKKEKVRFPVVALWKNVGSQSATLKAETGGEESG